MIIALFPCRWISIEIGEGMSIKIKAGYIYTLGTSRINDGINFVVEATKTGTGKCFLHLYKKLKKEPDLSVEFPKEGDFGSLRSLWISGLSKDYIAYSISDGIKDLEDRRNIGRFNRSRFGKEKENGRLYYRLPSKDDFLWGKDEYPNIESDRILAYKLHVRGFTAAMKQEDSGTFKAILGRIAYLKSIGVNQIELMPSYEFDETEYLNTYVGNRPSSGLPLKPVKLINYWGYKKADYFAVKSSYAFSEEGAREFKTLVRELHKNKMELIMEFYFDSDTAASEMIDVLKYYISEYHIDGVHIASGSPINDCLKNEPFLEGRKLYLEYTEALTKSSYHYNDGFLVDARRYIKGDDYALNPILSYFMPESSSRVNYFAGHNGFSLADCFSYDRKHNEKNGFDNMDGTDHNFSWNCGKEGASKSKKINDLRLRLMKNALFITLMSRGIPLIHAGDEMGKTKKGNNNSFCQDNMISYIEWEDIDKNRALFEFFRSCVSFRQRHPILSCTADKLKNNSKTGWPLLSFHSDKAWNFKVHGYDKAVGILYNGEYFRDEDNHSDSLLYIGMNMHYDKVSLALPILPKGLGWKLEIDSSDLCELKENTMEMQPRSVVALVAEHSGKSTKLGGHIKKR